MFAAFMAGAGCYVAEAGAVNYFLEEPDGSLTLSPLGEIGMELYHFTHSGTTESVRGIPYVPLALVTSASVGLGLGFFYQSQSWDVFPLDEEEEHLLLFLETLWPGSLQVESVPTPDDLLLSPYAQPSPAS